MTAQGIEAEGRNTEGGSVHESPVDKVDAPPSLPPTGEGLPEEIVKAIEAYGSARYTEGYFYDGEHDARPVKARSTLDATILRHLSAALARAERAEKALEKLEAHRERLFEPWDKSQAAWPDQPAQYRFGDDGRCTISFTNKEAREILASLSSVAEEA